jgi:predicted lipoprotein with Yx(FWY)xxD motif
MQRGGEKMLTSIRHSRIAWPLKARSRWRVCLGIIAICAGFIIAIVPGGGSIASAHPATRSHDPTYEVTTGEVSGLGTVLVDGKGLTLYLFLPDKHSSHSRCSDICAVAWPPLLLPKGKTAPLAGRGVRSSLLGTTIRSDVGRQVTYNGWPLYRWANDASPGQATGQGLNNLGGLWYVVSPRGEPIRS